MDIREEREPGECSRTPSPDSEIVILDVTETPKRRTNRHGNSRYGRNKSLIELVDLVEEDHDEDIEVLSDENGDDESGELFVLDTEGAEVVEVEGEKKSPNVVTTPNHSPGKEERGVLLKPSKTRRTDEIFDVTKILTNDAVVASPSEEKKESLFKVSCFNCGGEHTLQQCDIPLNQRRIAVNRAAHFNNKRSAQERYTTAVDTVLTGKYDIRPGEISDALREALGIGPNDIPEWIYRMRRKGFIDGYPPGYLTEALDQSSGEESLLEFHTDDKTLGTPRSREKDKKQRRFTVCADKVIAYPGFNYYNRYLRDRERFRVPRFDEYVRYLQEYVREKHADLKLAFFQQKLFNDCNERNRKRGKYTSDCRDESKRTRNDLHDDVVLHSDGPGKSGEKKRAVVANEIKPNTPSVHLMASASPMTAGSHSGCIDESKVSFGTPVVCRLEHDKKKPSLEKFRDGVVPFEAVEECTGNRGFFRALMLKIRKKTNNDNLCRKKI
uniref:PSP proline-rich domain-containing protein n=1 Tax=Setaria digitata TaxID=48799 RepID=A0A915PIE9_9BILA